jgi:hypothetical protein
VIVFNLKKSFFSGLLFAKIGAKLWKKLTLFSNIAMAQAWLKGF